MILFILIALGSCQFNIFGYGNDTYDLSFYSNATVRVKIGYNCSFSLSGHQTMTLRYSSRDLLSCDIIEQRGTNPYLPYTYPEISYIGFVQFHNLYAYDESYMQYIFTLYNGGAILNPTVQRLRYTYILFCAMSFNLLQPWYQSILLSGGSVQKVRHIIHIDDMVFNSIYGTLDDKHIELYNVKEMRYFRYRYLEYEIEVNRCINCLLHILIAFNHENRIIRVSTKQYITYL